jgi:type IV pilus assembly protein PilN
VILINLLPHREERRRRRKVAFFVGTGVAAGIGALIVGVWLVFVEQLIEVQQERNRFLGAEVSKLEAQIKDIATLTTEIESLKARRKAVEDLQIDRNVPVHLLNELVKQTPEGMYLVSVKQDGQVVNINGVAQTQERVSEFLRNAAGSEWLVKPELVESKAVNQVGPSREQRRFYDFSVRVSIKRPQDARPLTAPAVPSGSASKPLAPTPSKKA